MDRFFLRCPCIDTERVSVIRVNIAGLTAYVHWRGSFNITITDVV